MAPITYEEFKNEINEGDAELCSKLDPELMHRVINFSRRLRQIKYKNEYPLYLRLNSCYRPQDKQRKFHYARMITWSVSEIQANVRVATTSKKSLEIQKNALDAFKKMMNITDDTQAMKEAKKWVFGSNPAAAAEDDCPCGCGWPRSVHTFDRALAIDANIFANDGYSGDTKLVSSTSRPNTVSLYQQIAQASKDSDLDWGINWNPNSPPYILADPIHWEIPGSTKPAKLPAPAFPPNPGPLPAWDLRNHSQGGQGPLVKGDSRKDLVKHLQVMLKELGYNIGSSGVDGIFGSNTETAVKSFQSSHKDFNGDVLAADGLVGALTADAFNRSMMSKNWYNSYTVPPLLVQYHDEVRTGKKIILPDSP